MAEKQPVARPWWVKVTLWGLPNRFSAWFCVWLCLTLGMGFVFLGLRDWRFSLGAVWLLGMLGYMRAIRWVDRNGGWQ